MKSAGICCRPAGAASSPCRSRRCRTGRKGNSGRGWGWRLHPERRVRSQAHRPLGATLFVPSHLETVAQNAPRIRRHQGHNGVPTGPEPVHPTGKPISHSVNAGLKVGSGPEHPVPPCVVVWRWREERSLMNNITCCGRPTFRCSPFRYSLPVTAVGGLPWASRSLFTSTPGWSAVGERQDEEPLPLVPRTDLRRREQARRNSVAQFSKVVVDLLEAHS